MTGRYIAWLMVVGIVSLIVGWMLAGRFWHTPANVMGPQDRRRLEIIVTALTLATVGMYWFLSTNFWIYAPKQ